MLKTTVHETHGNYQRVLSKKIMEMVKQLFNVSLVYLWDPVLVCLYIIIFLFGLQQVVAPVCTFDVHHKPLGLHLSCQFPS